MKSEFVLLTFCGSIEDRVKGTTIGDVMALYNVAKRLLEQGINIKIAWIGNLFDLNPMRVALGTVDPETVSHLVYVCGPLRVIAGMLCKRFERAKKIAVGVSVVEQGGSENQFQIVVPRDSVSSTGFDLALADIGWPHMRRERDDCHFDLGICLVGRQGEYQLRDRSSEVHLGIAKLSRMLCQM